MTGCLYECLQEARLERYHAHFVRHGIVKCDGLATLSMQDYSRFGITRMEDRVRLFKLVQIVKSVQAEGRFCKHEAAKMEASRPLPQFATSNGQDQLKTRGQAFVQYLKSKTAVRASGSGLGDGLSGLEVECVPRIKPESALAPTKKKIPRDMDEVRYRPGTGSPIFKCRKILTFSDSESDDEEEDEERTETPDTGSITDSEIRQKVLSTITPNPEKNQPRSFKNNIPTSISLQSFQRNDPIRVTVPPPKSFFVDMNRDPSADQNSRKQLISNNNLFGISTNQIREPCVHGSLPQQDECRSESPIHISNQKRISSNNEHENGNISAELLAKKTISQATRQESVDNFISDNETDSDTDTDEYFELPKPSSSPEKQSGHPSLNEVKSVANITEMKSVLDAKPLKPILVGQQTRSIEITSQPVNTKKQDVEYNPAKYSPQQKHSKPVSASREVGDFEEGDKPLLRSATAVALAIERSSRSSETKGMPRSALLRDARQRTKKLERSPGEVDHAYFPRAGSATSPVRETVVERVVHSSAEYNYGVPGSLRTESPSRHKAVTKSNSQQRIRVCVRKRPLTRREQKRQEVDVVSADGADTIVVDETKVAIDLAKYVQQHVYMFDEVFDETKSNKDVYTSTAKPLVKHIFNKGCATCFAFGQTGAGKTYTLLGTPAVPGLYRLAAADMFVLLHSGQYGSNLHLWVSYYEIYCSQLYDLLNKRKKLYVRENGRQRVCIAGLMETRVRNVEDVAQVVQYGNSVRSTGSTGVNPNSSRSHALLQLEIRDSRDQRLGRMSFIDLAGSERASDVTEFDRQTRIEGAEINQSLLALKECIRSLDQESRHTPYRQSKLTHILRDSFVGNSRTCMIANISPSLSACENTLNTLRYADRVKELRKSTPHPNPPPGVSHETPTGRPYNATLFHPSNIQFSSTPKQNEQEKGGPRDLTLTLQQDPCETPIRGHKIRKTPEKRKVTPPQKSKRSPASPVKTSPFAFKIEQSGGVINIKTSKEAQFQNSNTESWYRGGNSSHGSLGSAKQSSPQSNSTKKHGDVQRSPRSAGSSSREGPKGGSYRTPQNNENSHSRPASGERRHQGSSEKHQYRRRKSSYGLSEEGKDSEYPSALKIHTMDMHSTSSNTGSKWYLGSTSPTRKYSDQSSSSHTRSNFVEEHRQILNHLDNIMDRAKAAIVESSSCENSPEKISPPHSSIQNIQPLGSLHKKAASRIEANRVDELQRYDEVIARQSALYDRSNWSNSKVPDSEPLKQDFRELMEDIDSTEDYIEYDKEGDQMDCHMPDGHHFSPQRDDNESQNGDEQQESRIEGLASDGEGDPNSSSASSVEDEYCSCSSSSHPRIAHSGASSADPTSRSTDQQLTIHKEQSETNIHQEPNKVPTSENKPSHPQTRPDVLAHSVEQVSGTETPVPALHHSNHAISQHVDNIRQLLAEEAPQTSARATEHSMTHSDDQKLSKISLTEEDQASEGPVLFSPNKSQNNSTVTQKLNYVPSNEFLQSLADIKIGHTSMMRSQKEDVQEHRLSRVNPALARLRQTFKTADNSVFKQQILSQSSDQNVTSFQPYPQSTGQLTISSSEDNANSKHVPDASIDVCSKLPETSDSGISTQPDMKLSSQDYSDRDPELVSSASTLDGVVSLSAQPEEESQWEAVQKRKLQLEKIVQQQSWEQILEKENCSQIDAKRLSKHKSLEEAALSGSQHGHEKHQMVGRSMSQTEIEYHTLHGQTFTPIHPHPATEGSSQMVVPASVVPVSLPIGLTLEGECAEKQMSVDLEELRLPIHEAVPPISIPNDELTTTPRSHRSSSSTHSSGSAVQRSQGGGNTSKSTKRNLVMLAHEEQLSEITAICKQEMRLLVAVRSGEKTFNEYMEDTETLLSSKAAAISVLRAQVAEFLQHPVLRSAGNTPR